MWFLINDGSPLTGSSAQILDERCRSVGYEDLLPKGLPASIQKLLSRCLAVNPNDRFRDCHELEAAAQACIEELLIVWETPMARESEMEGGGGSKPSMAEHYSWQKEWKTSIGEAYLGTEISSGRRVKVTLFDRFATGAGQFIKAAKLLEQIRHPNIAKYFSVREFREGWLVAREWVSGLDLMAFLQQTGPVKVKHASGILRQIAAALDFAAENHPAGLHDHPSSVILEISGDCDDHTPEALQSAVESGSVRAKLLPVLAEAAVLSTNSGTQAPSAINTIIETASTTSSGHASAFSPLKSFSKLVYWIVGGRQVPSVRFEAVPGLEEGSNRIIRDVLSDKISGVKCSEICEQLLSIEGVGSSLAEWIDQIKENLTQGFSELQDIEGQMLECEQSLHRLKQEVDGPDLLPPDHVQSIVSGLDETIAHCIRRASGFNSLADEATTTAETYSAGALVEKAGEMRSAVSAIEETADKLRVSAGEIAGSFARSNARKVSERARALANRAREIGKKAVPIRRRAEGSPSFQAASEARKATSDLLDELYIAKDELTELTNTLAQAERDLETRAAIGSSAGTGSGTSSPSAYQSLALADSAIAQATEQVNKVRDLLAAHLATHLSENTAAASTRGAQTRALVEDLHTKALAVASDAVKARVKGDPDAAEAAQRELAVLTPRLREAENAHEELKDILAAGLNAAGAVANLPENATSPLHKAEGDLQQAGEWLEAIRAALSKAAVDAESARVSGRLQRSAQDAEHAIGKADTRVSDALREAEGILGDLRKALKQRDATALAMHREKSRILGDQIPEIAATVDAATGGYDSARRACEKENFLAGLGILKSAEQRNDSLRKRLTELRALQKALAAQAAAEFGSQRQGIPGWMKIAALLLLLGGAGTGAAIYFKDKASKVVKPPETEDPLTPIPNPGPDVPTPLSEYVTLDVRQRNFPSNAKLTLKPKGSSKATEISGEVKQGGVSFKAPRQALADGGTLSLAASGYEPLTDIAFVLSENPTVPLNVTLQRLTANVRLSGSDGKALDERASAYYAYFYSEIVFSWQEPLPDEDSVPPEADKIVDIATVLKSGAELPTGRYEAKLRRARTAPPIISEIETGSFNRLKEAKPSWRNEEVGFSVEDLPINGTVAATRSTNSGPQAFNLPAPPPPLLLGYSSIEDNVMGGIALIPANIVLRFPRLEILVLAPGNDWSKANAYEENIGATLQTVFVNLQETAKATPRPKAGDDSNLIEEHLGQLATALGTATSARKDVPTSLDQLQTLVQLLEAFYRTYAVGEIVAGGAEKVGPGMTSAFFKDSLDKARASVEANKRVLDTNQWPAESGSVLFADHPFAEIYSGSVVNREGWADGLDTPEKQKQFVALLPVYLAEAIILNGVESIRAARSTPASLSDGSLDFRSVLAPSDKDELNAFSSPVQAAILQSHKGYFREYPMLPESLDAKGGMKFAVPYATQGQQDSFSIILQGFTISQSRGDWSLVKEIPSRPDSYSPLKSPEDYFKDK